MSVRGRPRRALDGARDALGRSELVNTVVHRARMFSWVADPRRFRSWEDIPIDRPVFLLGVQGGGLTLLCRMLRRNPQVISAGGNDGYWTSADEMQQVYGPVLPFELTGLTWKAPDHPTLPPPRSWTYAARDLYPTYRRRAGDATPELAATLRHLIRFSAVRHAHDPTRFRFVDKSQVFTVRMGLVHALLADCDPRFVLVTRDPYAATMRAAGTTGPRGALAGFSFEERVDIFAEHWANSMRAVLDDERALGVTVHRTRFEDLLRDPESSLRAVSAHVEVDFEPTMLPAAGQRLPLGTRHANRWYPLRADVNRRYESVLEGPEGRVVVDRVQHHAGDLVDELGYRRPGS